MLLDTILKFVAANAAAVLYLTIWYKCIWGGWPESHTDQKIESGRWPAGVREGQIDLYRSLAWGLFALIIVLYPLAMVIIFSPGVLGYVP